MDMSTTWHILTWVATLCTGCGLWFTGNKNTIAWPISMLGTSLWFAYAISSGQVQLAAVNLGIIAIEVRGFILWRRDDAKADHVAANESPDA